MVRARCLVFIMVVKQSSSESVLMLSTCIVVPIRRIAHSSILASHPSSEIWSVQSSRLFAFSTIPLSEQASSSFGKSNLFPFYAIILKSSHRRGLIIVMFLSVRQDEWIVMLRSRHLSNCTSPFRMLLTLFARSEMVLQSNYIIQSTVLKWLSVHESQVFFWVKWLHSTVCYKLHLCILSSRMIMFIRCSKLLTHEKPTPSTSSVACFLSKPKKLQESYLDSHWLHVHTNVVMAHLLLVRKSSIVNKSFLRELPTSVG